MFDRRIYCVVVRFTRMSYLKFDTPTTVDEKDSLTEPSKSKQRNETPVHLNGTSTPIDLYRTL